MPISSSLDINQKAIVLVGDFNPKIFQPYWFAKYKLIKDREAEDSKVTIIHQQIADFSLEWCQIQVNREKFIIITKREDSFELIKDLVIGCFRLLKFTPISALGINSEVHFKIDSEAKWHEFGNKITPKNLWEKFMKKPGMIDVQMEDVRYDGKNGMLRVSVQPSLLVTTGVFISINDHFNFDKEESKTNNSDVIETLESGWKPSNEKAKQIIDNLKSLYE